MQPRYNSRPSRNWFLAREEMNKLSPVSPASTRSHTLFSASFFLCQSKDVASDSLENTSEDIWKMLLVILLRMLQKVSIVIINQSLVQTHKYLLKVNDQCWLMPTELTFGSFDSSCSVTDSSFTRFAGGCSTRADSASVLGSLAQWSGPNWRFWSEEPLVSAEIFTSRPVVWS